uniref:FAR1 domain-containing protein n=1 Tax=Heterorhabditis bacteriophora TaxID=37862 RepID=A0A1I7X871_HETBA
MWFLAAKIVATSGRPIATQSSTDPSHATAVPPSQAVTVNTSQTLISHDARFHSYAEFEEAFEVWKRECLHPFRVASSETLREPDGTVNTVFKYRYVVFHCAHYGEPRMRGIGKRPNQNYLPSGCRAMLRLNYNFNEQVSLNYIYNSNNKIIQLTYVF